jgi:hypothetical protein
MKEGLRSGAGTYTWSNGEQYAGSWSNDKREGEGVHTWPSGAKYTGSFKGNKRHGKGKLVWAEDHSYEGDWENGERSGQGTFHWPDGEKYVGGFKSGGRSGTGVNERPDGQRYVVSASWHSLCVRERESARARALRGERFMAQPLVLSQGCSFVLIMGWYTCGRENTRTTCAAEKE